MRISIIGVNCRLSLFRPPPLKLLFLVSLLPWIEVLPLVNPSELRSVTFVNFFLSLHFCAEFCIILALSFDGSFDMKNEASDASWIGTITSILFTNAKTVTNYTYVLLLIRVSVSVALLNSFKSMYLRPRFNGSRQIFQRTKLARINLSGFRDTQNHASFSSAKRAKFCSRISTVQSKRVAQVKFIRSKIFPDQGKLGLPI